MSVSNKEIISFINQFSKLAIKECNRRIASGEPFILPSVCMAQAALESTWGTAPLMKNANAYFGVKAGGSWTGAVYVADTKEVYNGTTYNTRANFRAYGSPEESVIDYYALTCGASRYSKALSYGSDKSKWLTPRETVTALWQGGYATDDNYVNKIMNTLNGRDMSQYDALITGEATATTPSPSFLVKPSEMVQGRLIIMDSGRTIANNNLFSDSVAVKWEDAPVVDSDTTFTVNVPDGYDMYIATLIDDLATIGNPVVNGQEIQVSAGLKIGFYLVSKTGEATAPDEMSSDLIIGLSSSWPNADEIPGASTLAFFVKVE